MRPAEVATGGSRTSHTAEPLLITTTRGVQRRGELAIDVTLALLGAALGLSQTIGGAYDEATWGPIALGALALVLTLAVGLPRRLPVAALVPLLGLWLWSLLSSSWGDSADAAYVAAGRWLLYAAALVILCWAIGESRRRATVLLGGAAVGVMAVGIWMLARMLAGHGAALFLGPRLNDPLGYVNGQAGYLLAGVWPCLALAERRGPTVEPLLAAIGMSGVVVLTGLGLLTQSRSWGIALAATAIVLLIVVPGRLRRAAAIVLVGVMVVLLYGSLAAVWRQPNPAGIPTSATTHTAALAIVAAALGAGAWWGIAVWGVEGMAPPGSRARARTMRVATGALATLLLLGLVVVGVKAGSIEGRISSQYKAFVKLAPTSGTTRLLSGGGDRYDYWRVAMLEFRSEPIRGVGAGSYQPGYYLHRRTTEEIQQPHSLELQTLAELGLVGALLLAAFLLAVATGMVRTVRVAARNPLARTLAVAAGGTFAAWLVQTSVDWLHLLPGLTAIALGAAAGLLVRTERPTPARGIRALIVLLAVAIACAGTLTIAPRVLSLHDRDSAQRALAENQPRAAIADASRALDYDPDSVAALELRAAGFARLHAFAPARTDIRRAISLEPHNWVTWALLGDLLTRRGQRARARSAYAHAVALNPLEASLRTALASVRGR